MPQRIHLQLANGERNQKFGSCKLNVVSPKGTPPLARLGSKQYEITNHSSRILTASLGNVYNKLANFEKSCLLIVMPNNKRDVFFNNQNCFGMLATINDSWLPDNTTYPGSKVKAPVELTWQDYYPFGMIMPSRNYSLSTNEYRYGFNGKESDDEVNGEGNSYDFGARIYDSWLGRWCSVDPYFKKYTYASPYWSFGNNPIFFVDPGGETLRISMLDPKYASAAFAALQKLTKDKLVLMADGAVKRANSITMDEKLSIVETGVPKIKFGKKGTNLVNEIIDHKKTVTIENTNTVFGSNQTIPGKNPFPDDPRQTNGQPKDYANSRNAAGVDATVIFNPLDKCEPILDKENPDPGIVNEDGSAGRPSFIGLGHELIHGLNMLRGLSLSHIFDGLKINPEQPGLLYNFTREELNTRKAENELRSENFIKLRATPKPGKQK